MNSDLSWLQVKALRTPVCYIEVYKMVEYSIQGFLFVLNDIISIIQEYRFYHVRQSHPQTEKSPSQ